MTEQEESIYIERILAGETHLYATLVDRYKEMAFTIAVRIILSAEDAEEIVQDAFLKAYQNLHRFKRKAKFSTWLYRIVYNAAISKKRLRRYPSEQIEAASSIKAGEPDAYDKLDIREQELILQKTIEQLTNEEQTLLTLYYLNESSISEISKIMRLSQANVKIKLHRTRKKLYDMLVIKQGFNRENIALLNIMA